MPVDLHRAIATTIKKRGERITDIILPLVGCAILSALSGALAYDEKIRKWVVGAVGLLFLSLAVGTVVQAIADLPQSFETAAEQFRSIQSTDVLRQTEKEALEAALASYLAEQCDLDEEDILVTAENFDVATAKADKVKILLRGKARAADMTKIRELVDKTGIGNCEVDIEIG